jgi:type II secretory ATPase GspE/PulE/Tfp pilus assembly ATPase PilB-like protein
MGLEPYLLASTLNLIVAQRLVRRICEKCKEPIQLNADVLKRLKIEPEVLKNTTFYHGKGCNACNNTGYKGRLPIFEFLVMDSEIREMVITGSNERQIRTKAREKGYGGLLESGIGNMIKGVTTAEEVLSTTFTEDISAE